MDQHPRHSSFDAVAARIAYVEWGDRGAPAVLLVHATGFHARVWDQTVANLPKDLHVIAVDIQGHGRSEKRGPIRDWALPAQDIIELVGHLNLQSAVGVGHSMGGHTLVQVAATQAQAFKRLVLVDPVIMAPERYDLANAWPADQEHPIARRRNHWASWQDMFEAFKDRKPYSLWDPKVLADYCQHGVVLKHDGSGVELACPPSIEASIYTAATGGNIHHLTKQITIPVDVIRAMQRPAGPRDVTDFSLSPTWAPLATMFPNGKDIYLPELTHFIPMQDPQLMARMITEHRN